MKKKFPYRFRVLVFIFFLMIITYLDRVCIGLMGSMLWLLVDPRRQVVIEEKKLKLENVVAV